MEGLDEIGQQIREAFEAKNKARDLALQNSRQLIRHCSVAIRAVHRDERPQAQEEIAAARALVETMREDLKPYPDLFNAGYTRDAFKEYAEANIVYAVVGGEPIPQPEQLGIEYAPYLGGLGEAAGELRRRVLDIIRHGEAEEAERLLAAMDEIYGLLVTIDFPDAITGGLRRITDMVRGVTERTRGDLTTNLQQRELKAALEALERRLDSASDA